MMPRLIAVGILPKHTGAENRQLYIGIHISEHAVELGLEMHLSSHQFHQPRKVMLH